MSGMRHHKCWLNGIDLDPDVPHGAQPAASAVQTRLLREYRLPWVSTDRRHRRSFLPLCLGRVRKRQQLEPIWLGNDDSRLPSIGKIS